MRAGLTITEVATSAGVRPDTLRYYERAGLVPPPPRTSGAHRRYPAATVERLRFIRGAQRLGLRLSEIKNLLAVRDTGVCPCEPAEDLLRRHLADIDAELARLGQLRAEVVAMLAAPTCPDPAVPANIPAPGASPGEPERPMSWCPPDYEQQEGGGDDDL